MSPTELEAAVDRSGPTVHTGRGDRGSISVAVVLLVVVVLAGGGLVFDGARYLSAERSASNVAEGAARAAVAAADPARGLVEAEARVAAIDHARRAGIARADVAVSFPTPTTVEVTVRTYRPAVFGAFAGRSTLTAQATGRARLEYST